MSSSTEESESSCEEVDFNEYRKEYESIEHWRLRKAFLIKHWDLFEEDEILCLAQVFVNMEFLGCKYPAETMLRVAELAQAVPEIVKYRVTRRNNLKRTFVGAKDAVQAKLKKTEAPRKLGNVKDESSFNADTKPMAELGDWTTTDRAQFSMTLDKTQKLNNLRGLLHDVINFEVPENPSAGLSKTISYLQKLGNLEIKFDEGKFLYIFRGQIIGEGNGGEKKEARMKANEDLISTLKANCYTIVQKKNFFTVEEVVTPNPTEVIAQTSNKLKEDNLGFKMLKMLGWKGGSLGTKGEGIVDPVACEIKIGRRGLGGATGQLDSKYIRQLIGNFKESQVEYDLVFSNEFTKEERAQIHQIADQLNLRTKSYGRNESRHMVVSAKLSPAALRQKLIEGNDPCLLEKYEVIAPPPPTKIKGKKAKKN